VGFIFLCHYRMNVESILQIFEDHKYLISRRLPIFRSMEIFLIDTFREKPVPQCQKPFPIYQWIKRRKSGNDKIFRSSWAEIKIARLIDKKIESVHNLCRLKHRLSYLILSQFPVFYLSFLHKLTEGTILILTIVTTEKIFLLVFCSRYLSDFLFPHSPRVTDRRSRNAKEILKSK